MGTFGKSFTRELGKNTGKWVSNKVFGDGHATPHKVLIQRKEREERTKEREAIAQQKEYEREQRKLEREETALKKQAEREEKLRQREELQRQKLEEKEFKKWQKEQEKLEKEEALENNRREVQSFNDYLDTIQNIHTFKTFDFSFADKTLENVEDLELFKRVYFDAQPGNFFTQSRYDFKQSTIFLCWALLKDLNPDHVFDDQESQYFRSFAEENEFQEAIRRIEKIYRNNVSEVFEKANAELNNLTLFNRIQAVGHAKKVTLLNNNLDSFRDRIHEISDSLNIPSYLVREVSNDKYLTNEFSLLKDIFWSNAFLSSEISNQLPPTRPTIYDQDFQNEYKKIVTVNIEERISSVYDELINEYGADYLEKHCRYDVIKNKIDELENQGDSLNKNIFSKLINYQSSSEISKEIDTLRTELYSLETDCKNIREKEQKINSLTHTKKQIEDLVSREAQELLASYDSLWTFSQEEIIQLKNDSSLALEAQKEELSAIKEILSNYNIFEFLEDYGSSYSISEINGVLEVDLYVNPHEVIPTNRKSINSKGEIIEKPFPISERNLIIQDYICSSILRVANEFFGLLFNKTVLINALVTELNPKTGNDIDITIVSTWINREALGTINLQRIDPSDTIEHLGCNMKFTKSKGFTSVEKVKVKATKPKPIKEVATKNTPSSTTDSSFIINSNDNVETLTNTVTKLFNVNIEVYTLKKTVASERRKLKSLTKKEFDSVAIETPEFNREAIKEIRSKTGLTVKILK